jgi:sodium-dependent dicarboxylate transporter 2/3/5
MLLPILASVSISLGVNPLIIMISATIAASCAFMLPVATPPNAVVFGSGYLKIKDMIRTGLFMNFISIIIVSLYVYYVLPLIWDLDQISLINKLR